AVRLVPVPPYKLQPLDSIVILATGVNQDEPINGIFGIDPEGTVNLGYSYGTVRVADLTLEQAQKVIEDQLHKTFEKPQVRVSLNQAQAMQQIRGDHLVRPDGTIGLGTYGAVYIQGLTIEQARAAIESHLSRFLSKPEISVDVFAYNSKAYY